MKKTKIVYAHFKPDNTIFYIGSGNLKRAYTKHGRSLWWHQIVKKYGYYVKVIFKDLSIDEAIAWERYLVRLYGRRDLLLGPLVNLCDPVVSGIQNLSEETKLRMSLCKKGKPNGRIGLPGTNLGKRFTEDHKLKISKAHKGKTFSSISRAKMSLGMKGRKPWNTGMISHNAKAVLQIKDGQIINEYTSAYEAAKVVNGYPQAINSVCRGKNKSHKGFVWKFKNQLPCN